MTHIAIHRQFEYFCHAEFHKSEKHRSEWNLELLQLPALRHCSM